MAKQVVVYAASGYTGRLTCQSLTRLQIPFVAAGRNQARLDAVVAEMRAKGADCEAQVAEHSPRGLRDLLRGKTVVINSSGPFSLLGLDVVQAALDEGVHYLDTTGEQDFMFDVRRDYDARFAQKQLVLAPSTAFLWGIGAAAVEVCLETPGIDTLTATYAPPSLQTVASLQSMFRSVRRGGAAIANGSRTALPVTKVYRLEVPGRGKVGALAVGAGEATFVFGDARVKNCKTYFASDALARASVAFAVWNFAANRVLGHVVSGDTLDAWCDAAVVKLKKDPPAEDSAHNGFVVVVVGEGGGRRVRVQLDGHSPYVFTGFMGAMAAQEILAGNAKRFGYVSLAQTLGARRVLARIEEIGTTARIEVSDGPQAAHAPAASPQTAHA